MTDSGNAPEPIDGEPSPSVDPFAPDENAPYGYVIDEVTRERRPRKTPGGRRRGVRSASPPQTDGGSIPVPPGPPSLEQLRASGPRKAAPDRPPGARKDRRGRIRAPKAAPEVPPFRAGPIAKGVNQLYFKVGKLVRIVDPMIGQALIDITRKEDDDDITVGEAWEEIARTNPRIRAFLLRLITGGAWTQLFMAHAPVLLAVIMRDGIRERIPFERVVSAMLDDDDTMPDPGDYWPDDPGQDPAAPSGLAGLFDGLTPADVAQMGAMMNGLMSNMAGGFGPRQPAPARAPTVDDFGTEGAEAPP